MVSLALLLTTSAVSVQGFDEFSRCRVATTTVAREALTEGKEKKLQDIAGRRTK